MNNYKKYIKIININLFKCKIDLKIGNPMWFVKEIKNTLRKESK